MSTSLQTANALDKLFEIAADSDGAVILTYSLSISPIQGILAQLRNPKNIRLMYSLKSDSQKTVTQLEDRSNFKALETISGLEHFEIAHAKIYLFYKITQNEIVITFVLGSFNLTLQSWRNIEIFGVYTFSIQSQFLIDNGIRDFIEVFDVHNELPNIMLSMEKNATGQEKEFGLEAILLLRQLWRGDLSTFSYEQNLKKLFLKDKKAAIVSTIGKNTLLTALKQLLEEAFIYANENGKEVELLVVTPFHTEQGIEQLLTLKNNILNEINLNGKAKFQLKILTNSYRVSSSNLDKSSFSNPSFLKRKMFEPNLSPELKVKFWGYAQGNEDFIHAKAFIIKVGDERALLLTSANLTLSGFGFETQKNLEVGVVETRPDRLAGLCSWLESCWDSEYTIASKDDKIWGELQSWYDRLEEAQDVLTGFEVAGITDFYIYDKYKISCIDELTRQISSIKLIMSFAAKDSPVRNYEKVLRKTGEVFEVEISLREEHLGPVFCDLIAEMEDKTYLLAGRYKVEALEKPPRFKMRESCSTAIPAIFLSGTISILVDIEVGKGISEIDIRQLTPSIRSNGNAVIPEILLIREEKGKTRSLQLLLWTDSLRTDQGLELDLFYLDKKVAACSISKQTTQKVLQTTVNPILIDFLKNRSLKLVTDRKTLCPNIQTEFSLIYDPRIELMGFDRALLIRDFVCTELIGMRQTRKKIIEECQIGKNIRLKNDTPTNLPATVETWAYAVKLYETATLLLPIGQFAYDLLRNPPNLSLTDKTSIRTNSSPLQLEFDFQGQEIFKDESSFDCQIGEFKETIHTQKNDYTLNLPDAASEETLKKVLTLAYRFKFKYNIADIVGKTHLCYDLFVSTPNPLDSSNTRMLIFNRQKPRELVGDVVPEFEDNMRPALLIIPIDKTFSGDFELNFNGIPFGKTDSSLVELKDGVFTIRKLDPLTAGELRRNNHAKYQIEIAHKIAGNSFAFVYDLLYLEGIEENVTITREGGYGRKIVIYHPQEYQGEFQEDISKIVRIEYAKHLESSHIAAIKEGKLGIHRYMKPEIIHEIRVFIETIKSGRMPIDFVNRELVLPYESVTLSFRRVMDFIVLVKRNRHELRIKIK